MEKERGAVGACALTLGAQLKNFTYIIKSNLESRKPRMDAEKFLRNFYFLKKKQTDGQNPLHMVLRDYPENVHPAAAAASANSAR